MANLLSSWGYETLTACDGRDALQKLADFDADTILSDLNMPNLDGAGLLAELQKSAAPVEKKLDAATAKANPIERLALDEKKYRWLFNENAMATEKTSEGIRLFNADAMKLEKFLEASLG